MRQDVSEDPAQNRWRGVEFRHLAALAVVAETGSFRGAAEKLGYVQSAVSHQIAFLERLIGARLVERSRGLRSVTLTDAGRVLLVHAEGIVSSMKAARADLEALSAGRAGRLRIGMEPTVARKVLPGVLIELAAERPDIEPVPVEIADQEQCLALLEDSHLDGAFIDLPVRRSFEAVLLLVDPHVLVIPTDDPLAELHRELRLDDLAQLHMLGGSDARIPALRRPSGQAACDPRLVQGDAVAQALVVAGFGAAVLPRLAVEERPETVVLELGDLVAPRLLGLCWPRGRQLAEPLAALQRAAERSGGPRAATAGR